MLVWRAGDNVASLDLAGNECESVAEGLRQYKNLVSLCLAGNRLSALPTAAQVPPLPPLMMKVDNLKFQ